MKKQILLVTLLFLCMLSLYATTQRYVARIPSPNLNLASLYNAQGYDIATYVPQRYLDIVVSDSEYDRLKVLHPELYIVQTEEQLKQNLTPDSRDIPGYRNYQDMLQLINTLQNQYPGLLRVQSLGDTWGKIYTEQGYSYYSNYQHEVIAIMLSDNADIDEDEPAFYFMGAHHAREPISTEVCLEVLEHLLENYNVDAQITDMINSSEIWFVPIVNPDGHKIVLSQTQIWWRKNIRDNNGNYTFQHDTYGYGIDGVDLNRNYGHQWGYAGSTDDMQHPTYHGTGAFSEPETIAIRDFVASRHFLAGISYHSYGELVLYPFGYIGDIYAPDRQELSALAESMALSIPGQGTPYYTPSSSWGLYPAAGSTDDWAYGEHGIFAYTIELATQFIPPAAQIPLITQNNLEAAKILLNRKNHSTLSGRITDADTGLPLEAVVYVEGPDDQLVGRALYKSNPSWGSYYRFLTPGTHNVHYYAPGYTSVSRVVNVPSDGVSHEDVSMTPAAMIDVEIRVYDDNLNPLENAQISFYETDWEPFYTNQEGVAFITGFAAGTYRFRISKPGFETLSMFRELEATHSFIIMSMPMLSDDFESGSGLWSLYGNWGLSTVHFVSGNHSLSDSPTGNYSNNATALATLNQPIGLQNINYANLEFKIKHNLVLDGDYLALQLSTDGITWMSVDYFTGVSDWTLKHYSLKAYLGSNLLLRFLLSTNSGGTADGVYIDDLRVFMSSNPLSETVPVWQNTSMKAYPNPFSESLNLEIDAPGIKSPLNIKLYNLKGQVVATIGDIKHSGKSVINWNPGRDHGKNLATGVYFIKLSQGDKAFVTKKILYMP